MLPLLFILLRPTMSSCNDMDEYININATHAHRCSDDKDFFQTGRYNISTCNDSNYVEPGLCWWDTSYESHCLDSIECVWLDGIFDFGLCYCTETDDCMACEGKTPTPTIERTFKCDDQCEVYYLGCVGQYCHCGGECSLASNFDCANPSNPRCHTWRTTSPTEKPTRDPGAPQPVPSKFVLWSTRLCCLRETEINNTPELVAEICGVPENRVKIKSFSVVNENEDTRRREDAEAWNIVYEVELVDPSENSADDLISKLGRETSIEALAELMDSELGISLVSGKTVSVEEAPTEEEAGGGSGGISATVLIAILCGVAFVLIVAEVLRRMRRKYKGLKIVKGLTPTDTPTTKNQDSVHLLRGSLLHEGSSDSIPEAALVVASSESEKAANSDEGQGVDLFDKTTPTEGERKKSNNDDLHGL